MGCSADTIKARLAKSKKLQAIKDAESEIILDTAELGLKRAILAGEPWALKYVLSTKGKVRGYVEKTEVDVLLRQELEGVVGALEDGLEPDEFRKVAGVLGNASRTTT